MRGEVYYMTPRHYLRFPVSQKLMARGLLSQCLIVCVTIVPSTFAASCPVGLPFNCDKNVHMQVLMYIVFYNYVQNGLVYFIAVCMHIYWTKKKRYMYMQCICSLNQNDALQILFLYLNKDKSSKFWKWISRQKLGHLSPQISLIPEGVNIWRCNF